MNRAAQPIRLKTSTSTFWTAKDPTLLSGELGIESDTGRVKVGNGTDIWSSLSYLTELGPVPLAQYTVATVPAAASYAGSTIYVTDEAGGATMALSDGTNWRRMQDYAIIL